MFGSLDAGDALLALFARREAGSGDRVAEIATAEFDDVSTLDGTRIETDTGWFLVRASGTEPLVRLTAEARDDDAADALFQTARDLVERARNRR